MPDSALRLDDFLPYRLSFTSNLVSNAIASAYESLFALSIPQWRLIAVIEETGSVTQQAVGERTMMDKVTVSRAAIALVERGLIARHPNPDDRRSHLLSLTPAGADLHAQVVPKALDLERAIFAAFAPSQIAALTSTLRKIDQILLEKAT